MSSTPFARASIVAGLLALTVPAVVLIVQPSASEPPGAHRAPAQAVRTGWGAPERSSLQLLRRVIAHQSRGTRRDLGRCDARRPGYTRCAFHPLAFAGAAASTNGRMLLNLADDARPPRRCDELLQRLTGAEVMLGGVARTTLQDLLGGASRRYAIAAARSMRAAAANAIHVAADPAFAHACLIGAPRV
jgi:hypothetical protein